MPEEERPKQFDIIAKTESLLEAPIFSRLLAFAFYAEFVLRHFYGISFGDFSTFAALRDFAIGIKPLSLVFIIAGAALVPRVGFIAWKSLQALLFSPTYYFGREKRKEYAGLIDAGYIMRLERGKQLARKKKDDYLLKECEELQKEKRSIEDTKINIAAIFTITALNLIIRYYQQADAGLIMHNLVAQLAWLFATGIYAGFPLPDYSTWVSVPDGYTEDEIHSSRFKRLNLPIADKN
jgi:hypothetical protein